MWRDVELRELRIFLVLAGARRHRWAVESRTGHLRLAPRTRAAQPGRST